MDLMTGTYTYSSLSRKYQGFLVPAVKLSVGGTQLIGQKGIRISQVQVKQSVKAAGSASFSFSSQYDYENHSFASQVKEKAVLGKVVEVELGYGSDTSLVFKGFIASVGMEFHVEEGISFRVTALDARRLMMSDNKPYLNYTDKNYSDMVKKIMGRYGKLCSLSCEATSDNLTEPVCQRESDYDFITKAITGDGKADREFFIVADKAYFRKPRGSAGPLISLGIGTGLKSFERTATYLNRKIQVNGYDPDGKKQVSGQAAAKSPDKQDAPIDPGLTIFAESDCRTEAVAKAMAEARAKALEAENCQASGSCIGLPELAPGRYIKIQNVDPVMDREYYVTEVTHAIGTDGYQASFSIEGWK